MSLGAKFAKWRAVIVIDPSEGLPTDNAIGANAHALARDAALCQEGGPVPIVEPEVLMDGGHDIATCFEATIRTQRRVFAELAALRIDLEGMVLKPNMVLSGKDCSEQASPEEVAEQTLRCLYQTVPAAVPGIAFLSGGQSAEVATLHLDLMNKMDPHPWSLTFSYGRAPPCPFFTLPVGGVGSVSAFVTWAAFDPLENPSGFCEELRARLSDPNATLGEPID